MKVSVIIPTIAGRTRYLASSIATCLTQPDDFELIVSDNSPGDAEALVRGIDDPRIRYVRPPHFMTMSAHWDFALTQVQGDSVTIIGDDDGLMPGCIMQVNSIHQLHGNVLIHHPLCNYYWPDHPVDDKRNTVSFFHEGLVPPYWADSKKFLDDLLRCQANYIDGPMIYHNFVPLPLVRQISNGGPFFKRPIPDVYSSVALAANSARYYRTDKFLTIAGQGAKSNGALVNAGTSDGSTFSRESEAAAIYAPRFRSRTVTMLLLDSILEVAAQFHQPELAAAIDFPMFLENALLEARQMRGAQAKCREVAAVLRAAKKFGVLDVVVARVARRAVDKAGRKVRLLRANDAPAMAQPASTLAFDSRVQDIHSASIAVAHYLATRAGE